MSDFFTDDQLKELLDITKKDNNIEVSTQFHKQVQGTLASLPNRRPRKNLVIPSIIAAAIIISSTAVFANNVPIVKDIVTFFKSHMVLKDSKDTDSYEKYGKSIGKTVASSGVSITIDNVACDDNYLVLFYTAEGDGEKTINGQGGVPIIQGVHGNFKVNGKKVDNKVDTIGDSYITEDGKIKGRLKADISKETFTDELNIDFKAFAAMDKRGEWNFSLKVSKAATMKDTKIVNVNKEYVVKFQDHENHIKIEKVSITPFANSIVISESFLNRMNIDPLSFFALYDDKGNSLDILRKGGFRSSKTGARNSFEFIKGGKDMKSIRLVPVALHFDRPVKGITSPIADIDTFPRELKVSDRGSVVVQKVEFTDISTKIYYTLKGYIADWGMSGDDFFFVDDKGKDAYQNHSPIQWDYVLDREKGVYVNVLPPLDKTKKYKLGCHKDGCYEYLEDQSIVIPLNN